MRRLALVLLLAACSLQAATYVNGGTGNLSAAATWKNVEVGAGALVTTLSATANTAVAYATAAAFTCTNLDVVTAVWLHGKQTTVTGTVTIGLSDDNGATWTREVTINATDLPTSYTWFRVVLGSSLTCDGGADYKVSFRGSSAGNATFYRDGTADNWARILQLDPSPGAAPVAGDVLFIGGAWTGAATGSDYTVTMDDTTSIDFGVIAVGQRGIFSFGVSASTAYTLKLSGNLTVWAGSTFNMGTVASPMPASSTGTLNFDCTANVEFGLLLKDGSTFVAQGATKTVSTFLAADAAINATSLTSADSTGWKDNDKIAIASTTQTTTQSEQGTLNGDASGTTLTVDGFGGAGGGLAYAHSGTTPTRAEIINLTRNVQIFGASATLQAYVYAANLATVDIDYVEFYWLGSGTAGQRGIDVQTTTGSFSLSYSALRNFEVWTSIGVYASGGAHNNFTLAYNVFWKINSTGVQVDDTSASSWTLDHNIVIYAVNYRGFWLYETGGTITNNTAVSAGESGFRIEWASVLGTFSGNTAHSNGLYNGFYFVAAPSSGTLINTAAWRNASPGIGVSGGDMIGITFDGLTVFGNSTGAVSAQLVGGAGRWLNVWFKNCMFAGDSTFSSARGILLNTSTQYILRFENCDFGVASGIYVAHDTADIDFGVNYPHVDVVGWDVNLASTVQVALGAANIPGSSVHVQKVGAAGSHKSWYPQGTSGTDSVIFNTATPSERLTPTSTSVKLESGPKRVAVASGATATISVWVRKSEAGDGTAYDGAEPRLIQKANYAAGFAADVVCDTMTAAVGTWEQLSCTTGAATDDAVLEFVVDSDDGAPVGQGWVNVDDWALSAAGQDQGTQKYWFEGLPGFGTAQLGPGSGGGTRGTITIH